MADIEVTIVEEVVNVAIVEDAPILVTVIEPTPMVVTTIGVQGLPGARGPSEPQVPVGGDKEVQYNDGGVAGASSGFKFDKSVNSLMLGVEGALPDNPISVKRAVDKWLQINIQNTREGLTASSDLVATADNGTDITKYACLWIASSIFNDPDGYPCVGANDTVVEGDGGNLHVLTFGDMIRFFSGGSAAENEDAQLDASGFNLEAGRQFTVNSESVAMEANRPEIFFGTGSPPSAAGLSDGTLFFKYEV